MFGLSQNRRMDHSKANLSVTVAARSIAIASAFVGEARADEDAFLQQAKAYTTTATAPSGPWTGPTTRPKAAPGKFVIYVATDERTPSVSGLGEAVEEAAKVIGWKFRFIPVIVRAFVSASAFIVGVKEGLWLRDAKIVAPTTLV